MRNAFALEITALAQQDPRLVLLSGDIGNRLFDDLKQKAPERFYNCGVAEANMVSVAAGMALSGLKPVVYTIATFCTIRCLEQIRLDACYQNLPVVFVGAGAGLSYASLNASHQALEDIAFFRLFPNMTVLCPADAFEARAALRAALGCNGPVYIRLGKKGEPNVHKDVPAFTIGKAAVLREGKDVCLIATGTILHNTLKAAESLAKQGVAAEVVNMHTVKPLDTALLARAFSGHRLVVTVEEHAAAGGLGGAVAEWRAEQSGAGARLIRLGTGDKFIYVATDQEHARHQFGLDAEQIAATVLGQLR